MATMSHDRTRAEARPTAEVPLRDKVAFLASPDAHAGAEVETRETHMSWVFLAGERAYKLKKPVTYNYLDFSTLAAREADCRTELRLNRRLAPWVYLEVAPLTVRPDGGLEIGGEGAVADWLVVMARVPEDAMLDRAIERGDVTRRDIDAVAGLLASFYRSAEPADVTPDDHVSQFVREHEANRAMLTDPRFDLPHGTRDAALDAVAALLDAEPGPLAERARAGRIVDGHGDLRPEHVCLSDPPTIIDCLEFNRPLRLVDPFDELAFLGMECARLGADWIGPALIADCAAALDDRPSDRLIAFYTVYRACVRARLALAHLTEDEVRESDKWEPRARAYLALAADAAQRATTG